MLVCKTKNAEEDREKEETDDLQWLSTEGVDGEDGEPITWDGASTCQDDHSYSLVVQLVVHRVTVAISNSL